MSPYLLASVVGGVAVGLAAGLYLSEPDPAPPPVQLAEPIPRPVTLPSVAAQPLTAEVQPPQMISPPAPNLPSPRNEQPAERPLPGFAAMEMPAANGSGNKSFSEAVEKMSARQ